MSNKRITQLTELTDIADGDAFVIHDASDTVEAKYGLWSTIISEIKAWLTGRSVVTVGFDSACDYVCDGTADDVQIQAAIDAVNTDGGGKIIVKEGTYYISTILTMRNNVHLVGEGDSTIFYLVDGTNTGMIQSASGGMDNIRLANFKADGNSDNQTGGNYLIDIAGDSTILRDILIENLYVQNTHKHAIFLHGDTVNRYKKTIRGCTVKNHGANAVGYGIYVDFAPNTGIFKNTIIDSNGSDAIEMGNLGEIYTIGNYIEDGQLQFPFASNSIIANNIIANNTIQNDANTANNVIITGNQILNATPASLFGGITAIGEGIIVANNNVVSNSQFGIKVVGNNSVIKGNKVNGVDKDVNAITGIVANASSNAVVEGNVVLNANRGIQINNDDNQVINNIIDISNTGIYFSNSASSGHVCLRNMVALNNLAGCTTAIDKQNQTSATNMLRSNIGYITENSGTATIASGSTSIAVTHGLSVTPTTDDISVTPTNGMGNAVKFWITNLTSSQFTINVDVDPSTDTATFAWKAIVL